METAEAIRSHGWRQGSFLPSALIEHVRGTVPTPEGFQHAFVISQTCDLVSGNFEDEPCAEIIWVAPIEAINNQYRDGASFRRLHVEAESGGSKIYFEVRPHQRTLVPRRILASTAPDHGCRLAPRVLRTLLEWLTERYLRTPFPDEFNQRWKQKQKTFKKLLKKGNALIDRIQIRVTPPNEELPEDQDYQVDLCIVAVDAQWADPDFHPAVLKLVSDLEEAFESCEGIEVVTVDVGPPSELPLSVVYEFSRWDAFTHLTHRDNLDADA